ncbi:MAG: hypothetical protein HY812_00715 [Planctomycetes bacterium]|nr:hypothetical protein [Planctomycetota bacterium]
MIDAISLALVLSMSPALPPQDGAKPERPAQAQTEKKGDKKVDKKSPEARRRAARIKAARIKAAKAKAAAEAKRAEGAAEPPAEPPVAKPLPEGLLAKPVTPGSVVLRVGPKLEQNGNAKEYSKKKAKPERVQVRIPS